MKKIILGVLICLCFSIFLISVKAADVITESHEISVIINSKTLDMSDVPIVVSGRTLLPLRTVFAALGVQNDDSHIIWNDSEKSVTAVTYAKKIYLKVNLNYAWK